MIIIFFNGYDYINSLYFYAKSLNNDLKKITYTINKAFFYFVVISNVVSCCEIYLLVGRYKVYVH